MDEDKNINEGTDNNPAADFSELPPPSPFVLDSNPNSLSSSSSSSSSSKPYYFDFPKNTHISSPYTSMPLKFLQYPLVEEKEKDINNNNTNLFNQSSSSSSGFSFGPNLGSSLSNFPNGTGYSNGIIPSPSSYFYLNDVFNGVDSNDEEDINLSNQSPNSSFSSGPILEDPDSGSFLLNFSDKKKCLNKDYFPMAASSSPSYFYSNDAFDRDDLNDKKDYDDIFGVGGLNDEKKENTELSNQIFSFSSSYSSNSNSSSSSSSEPNYFDFSKNTHILSPYTSMPLKFSQYSLVEEKEKDNNNTNLSNQSSCSCSSSGFSFGPN
ncbi:MAG: hypothetical protein LBB09_00145, partial [Rickettsiales bacterium]|nr:hypothetical protein [Rickettsiales bacterium]